MKATMMRAVMTLALAAVAALWAAPAAAQATCPPRCPAGGGNLTFDLSTTAIAFPTPGVVDFDTGWIDQGGVIVTITSKPAGTAWELRLRANTATLGGYGKPVGDILWRHDGSTVWTPLSGTDQVILQGTGDQTITVHFRVGLDWAVDSPGAYSAGLTFSAVRL